VNYTITAIILKRQSNSNGLIVSTSSQSTSSSIDLTSHASRPSAAIRQLKDRFTSQFEEQLKQFRDNINMSEVSNTILSLTLSLIPIPLLLLLLLQHTTTITTTTLIKITITMTIIKTCELKNVKLSVNYDITII